MISLFFIDRDKYLNGRPGIKYDGEYNNLSSAKKRRIIDSLVYKVQVRNSEESLISLMLIFQPIFKALNSRFINTFNNKFDWTSDEFIAHLITEFYKLTKFEFCRKGTKGHIASYNHFITRKLTSRALCLLSKEKIRKKHHQRENADIEVSEINKEDDRVDLFAQYASVDTFHTRKELLEVFLEHSKTITDIENFSYQKYCRVYRLAIDGYSVSEIARTLKMSVSRASTIIKAFKETSKTFIREHMKGYKYK